MIAMCWFCDSCLTVNRVCQSCKVSYGHGVAMYRIGRFHIESSPIFGKVGEYETTIFDTLTPIWKKCSTLVTKFVGVSERALKEIYDADAWDRLERVNVLR